jgi:hypothetical protein
MGGGLGVGFGLGFRTVPSPTDFLNQHALVNAQRASGPTSNNVYAGNPNSYINRVRDDNFTPSYNVARRRTSSSAAVSRAPSLGAAAPVAAAAPASAAKPKPAPALASFFDGARHLVWPADAPVDGDLKPKRDVSDQASLAVLDEVVHQGRSTVGSATDARRKLLDYGRPALKEIRETATAGVADSFHSFLLSLYESLRQSAAAP